MNTITINNVMYKLPDEEDMLQRVLKHLDMVLDGNKTHIRLYDLNGATHELSRTYLQNVEIDVQLCGNN